jgi:hypothetical protein
LAWYRRLVAKKFDGSQHRQYPGRPRVAPEVETLVVRMARENTGWAMTAIVGALSNLAHHLSDQTVGNILRRHPLDTARHRGAALMDGSFITFLCPITSLGLTEEQCLSKLPATLRSALESPNRSESCPS